MLGLGDFQIKSHSTKFMSRLSTFSVTKYFSAEGKDGGVVIQIIIQFNGRT